MNTLTLLLAGIAGYLLGSINTSLVIGRFYGIDIRKHGSRNAGTTNTLRTLGKAAALVVLAGDVLKGVVSCLLGRYIGGDAGMIVGGAAAVVGHNWPVYFGFKGGKGALTSITVVFMLDWRIGFAILALFIITVAVTRFVSAGSIIGALFFPILAAAFGKSAGFITFAIMLGLLVIARHYSNILRLINGTEAKLGGKRESQ